MTSAMVSGLMPVISRNQTFSPRAKPAASIDAVVIGNFLQRRDFENVGCARGAADIRLDRFVDFVGRMRLDPLRRAPDRRDVGLHLRRVLVDGRLQGEMPTSPAPCRRYICSRSFRPCRRTAARPSPAPCESSSSDSELTSTSTCLVFSEPSMVSTLPVPIQVDFLVEPHRLHVIGRPDVVRAAERRHRDDRLAAVRPLPVPSAPPGS